MRNPFKLMAPVVLAVVLSAGAAMASPRTPVGRTHHPVAYSLRHPIRATSRALHLHRHKHSVRHAHRVRPRHH